MSKQEFKIGDQVEWVSTSNGSTKRKEGKVAEVLLPGKRPDQDQFRSLHKHTLGSGTRKHVSYVVLAGNTAYWPVVDKLQKVKITVKKNSWQMPAWMEPYRALIASTGGNSVEELMNADSKEANIQVNAPLAMICVAVKVQVSLLEDLHAKGLLK